MYRGSWHKARSLFPGGFGTTHDETARSDIDDLKRKVNQQNLLLQTLIALVLEKNLIEEEEFRALLDEVDKVDGVKDGELAEDKTPLICNGCGKKNGRDKSRCMWCGQELEKADVLVDI